MFREYMTARERVLAAFRNEPVDRIPLINPTSVANIDSMRLVKTFLPYAHYDSVKMAALASASHDILHFDTVAPYFSVCIEAAALGCDVDWGTQDTIPRVRSGILSSIKEFTPASNYLERKYIRAVLNAIQILKEKYRDSVAIIGKVIGPMSLAFYMYGEQNMQSAMILCPDEVLNFVEKLNQLVIDFALEQIEAGADIITVSDDASSSYLSRGAYSYFLLKPCRDICNAIRPSAFTIFHCSGLIMDRLDLVAESGFDAVSFDSRNDISTIYKELGGRVKLVGCINNPKTLLNGTVYDVRKEVFNCIERNIDFISPECAISCRVTNQNLLAIYDAIKLYYSKKI